ncbi:MAG: cob(I)yrinic acid a,c-diamide adenosyltransferase [bacterium]
MSHDDLERDLPGVVSVYWGRCPETSYAGYGQMLRVAGRNLKVLGIWFLKSPDHFGEEFALEPLKEHLDLFPMYPPMDFGQSPTADEVATRITRAMKLARETLNSREYDLIVWDEALSACEQGLIPWEDLQQLLDTRPDYLNLTLTGTACPDEVAAKAHTLLHFETARHHLDTQPPRRGLDR